MYIYTLPVFKSDQGKIKLIETNIVFLFLFTCNRLISYKIKDFNKKYKFIERVQIGGKEKVITSSRVI